MERHSFCFFLFEKGHSFCWKIQRRLENFCWMSTHNKITKSLIVREAILKASELGYKKIIMLVGRKEAQHIYHKKSIVYLCLSRKMLSRKLMSWTDSQHCLTEYIIHDILTLFPAHKRCNLNKCLIYLRKLRSSVYLIYELAKIWQKIPTINIFLAKIYIKNKDGS